MSIFLAILVSGPGEGVSGSLSYPREVPAVYMLVGAFACQGGGDLGVKHNASGKVFRENSTFCHLRYKVSLKREAESSAWPSAASDTSLAYQPSSRRFRRFTMPDLGSLIEFLDIVVALLKGDISVLSTEGSAAGIFSSSAE